MTQGFSRIDQELCTGCGNCVSTCPAEAIAGDRHQPHTISQERCVGCGRCVQVCSAYDTVFEARATARTERLVERGLPPDFPEPLFAAYDQCCISEVKQALADPKLSVLAQCSPAVCGALTEDLGLPAGSVGPELVVAALRRIGFRKVYASSLSAAIAVIEEAQELAHRLQSGGILPVINSSCPAAVKFIEQFHPDLLRYLATCKSPHMIAGALIKSRAARAMNADPANVFSVSIGPCTARKLEAARPEMSAGGKPHVDAVLTARELAYMIRNAGIDLRNIPGMPFDTDLPVVPEAEGAYRSPGDISEAVLRACSGLLKAGPVNLNFVETESERVRAASVRLGEFKVKAVAVTGLTAAIPLFEAMKKGKHEISFMELLACPMGCISGGGQPKVLLPQEKASVYARRAAPYSSVDEKGREGIGQHSAVQRIYQEYFKKKPGDKSNRALHTEYKERGLSH